MADVWDNSNHGFTTPSDLDHRPWIWVAGLLSCVYSLLALAARLTSKWDMLWYDDAILAISYAVSFGHWGTLFSSISHGLGVSTSLVDDGDETIAAKVCPRSHVKAIRLFADLVDRPSSLLASSCL